MSTKVIGKRFPHYERANFSVNNDHLNYCNGTNIKPPKRFKEVHYLRYYEPQHMDTVFFGALAGFDSLPRPSQSWYAMYDQQITVNRPEEICYKLPYGNIDFYIGSAIVRNSRIQDPETGIRPLRFPFRVATYFTSQNLLFVRPLLVGETPKEDMLQLVKWIFNKVDAINYSSTTRGVKLMIGADPEFHLYSSDNRLLQARDFFPTVDADEYAPVGCDGHSTTGELRPEPKECPLELTEEVGKLFNQVAEKIGDDVKVVTGGGVSGHPAGHHIHFNIKPNKEIKELLDIFVGYPVKNIKGAQRPEGSGPYGDPRNSDALRDQPHGFEYRVPPSCLIPELTKALHTTAFCVVSKWESLEEGEEIRVDIDDTSNVPTLETYRSLDTTPTKKYTPHLEEFHKWVLGEKSLDPKKDILHRWVPGRKEVTTVYFVKVNWGDVFPRSSSRTEKFPLPNLQDNKEVTLFIVDNEEGEEETTEHYLYTILPQQEAEKINKARLRSILYTFGFTAMRGVFGSSFHLGFSKQTIQKFRTSAKMEAFLSEVINALFGTEEN